MSPGTHSRKWSTSSGLRTTGNRSGFWGAGRISSTRHVQQSPASLGPEEIRAYQVYLTNDKTLAVAAMLVTVAALRFLYTVTRKKTWSVEEIRPAPRKPDR